jgi:hypothetical protein
MNGIMIGWLKIAVSSAAWFASHCESGAVDAVQKFRAS